MPRTLGEIAEVIDADLNGDPGCMISGFGTLSNAGSGELSFLANRRYCRFLKDTRAAAVILGAEDRAQCPVPTLVAADPYLAYVKAVRFLNPDPTFQPGIAPGAVVADGVKIPDSAFVGSNAVVGEGCRVGERVYIGPGSVIGRDCSIGEDSRLLAAVTLCERVCIGSRVLLHPGSIIGADGFGLANDGGRWLKIPQTGTVRVGDDVEIGANSTVDRGALDDTRIDEGVKIDNLVQIGHNVVIGAHTAIAGGTVIAGSVTIGKRCMIGGASALSGHIEIADDVVITGMSGVPNSIKSAGVYSGGIPLTDNRTWRRNATRFKHLDELARRITALEREINELKKS